MSHAATILIVDDEPTARDTLEALLYSRELKLEFAANGPEALAKMQQLEPDLVLLDIMMPGMNGFEVCRRLRNSPAQAEVPIIMITALDDRKSRIEGIEAGADDFITKPFDGVELQARVRSITRLNRYRRLLVERREAEAAQKVYAERLQNLSLRLLETQESERRFLALELHDEIGQILTALKLLLSTGNLAKTGLPEMAEAATITGDLLSRVRELSLDLRPPMLDDFGLLPALEWLLPRYTARTKIKLDFKQVGLEKRVPATLETAVYRLVQEALTNVSRHADASSVILHLWVSPDAIGLQIEDDGHGFDVEAALAAGISNGLSGMRERVALLGGRLEITSIPEAGTSLLAHLPLERSFAETNGRHKETEGGHAI